YDPAFTNAQSATMRGAYASADHAEAGPVGIGAYLTQTPEFAPCVAKNVAISFLGRAVGDDDGPLLDQLQTVFSTNGFRVKTLVGALLRADAYRLANNLKPSAWRDGGGP